MEPAAPRRPLRLLALHSFRTSAAIFRRQLARLGGLDGAELVFIDAPHAASGPLPEDVAGAGFEGPFFEWFTVEQARFRYLQACQRSLLPPLFSPG